VADPASPIPVNILVVDDREENRVSLRAILSASGYRLVEAESGAQALRRLLTDDFAVLLIDVVMPQMSGFELATVIKGRERTAAIPIVFLTAQATDLEMIYSGYRAGAVDYLLKPLSPEMVRAKVDVFAELYRQRKRIEQQAQLLIEAERRESELRLVELGMADERRYRSLADAVPLIIWTTRPDGKVDYFNHRWFEYTGVSAMEAAGSWRGVIHPDDVDHQWRSWKAALGLGQMLEAECRLRAADGSYRWHLCRAVPERNSMGQVLSWLGTFIDIEDQKRTQAVLAEFKGTLDAIADAVLIFEPRSWRFLYLNDGASLLLGYSREELSQMRLVDLMVEHDNDRFRELLAPLQQMGSNRIVIETRCRRKDGREIPVEFSFQRVEVDGGHVVSIARDITDRKLAELEREHLYGEALDAVRARDEFMSVASHELRTPLSSLQLQIEMVLRPPPRAPPLSENQLKEKLKVAARQIDRISKLITELMDVSRISAGRLHLELEPVSLEAVVADVVTRSREDAARAQCQIVLHADEPVLGTWDRLRMEQVVTNLLSNALKFGAGKPIEVSVGRSDGMGRLVVRDHGIGIAPEDIERVFQRFERAVPGRRYAGLGLGLYIVRQIVEAHGGQISVQSQPGAGSAFTVELPLEPRPPAERLPPEQPTPSP
jgi:PAS domain S-box-containing protein